MAKTKWQLLWQLLSVGVGILTMLFVFGLAGLSCCTLGYVIDGNWEWQFMIYGVITAIVIGCVISDRR